MHACVILQARDLTAKVADVGLAKFMTGDQFTQVSTLGTLAWAAPELLRYATQPLHNNQVIQYW